MGQFGLLVIPVIVILYLLSGGVTPLESMPDWLRILMLWINPSTHFVSFAQSVLYRGSNLALVYPNLLAIAAMGGGRPGPGPVTVPQDPVLSRIEVHPPKLPANCAIAGAWKTRPPDHVRRGLTALLPDCTDQTVQ